MKIQNEEACNEAMQQAWKEWHSNTDPDLIPEIPTLTFRMAIRLIWPRIESLVDEIAGNVVALNQAREENEALSELLGKRTKEASELLLALNDLYNSNAGMVKSCGHEYTCICPSDQAAKLILKYEDK
jgi:hypothetical protein